MTAGSSPAVTRRSTPRRYASAAARYWVAANSRVTLIGIPANVASSIAGRPSGVPGILMNTLGRSAWACSAVAWAMVADAPAAVRPAMSVS